MITSISCFFFLILSSLWPIGWSSVVNSHPNDCAVVAGNGGRSHSHKRDCLRPRSLPWGRRTFRRRPRHRRRRRGTGPSGWGRAAGGRAPVAGPSRWSSRRTSRRPLRAPGWRPSAPKRESPAWRWWRSRSARCRRPAPTRIPAVIVKKKGSFHQFSPRLLSFQRTVAITISLAFKRLFLEVA